MIASWKRDVERELTNLIARRNVAAFSSNLGRQAFFRQDHPTVRIAFTEVYTQMTELAKLELGDPFAELDVARAEYNMGFAMMDPLEARNWYEKAYQRRVTLRMQLPTNAILLLDLIRNANTLRSGYTSDPMRADE